MCLPLSPTDYRERSSNDDVQGQRYEYVQPQAKQRLLFLPSEHFLQCSEQNVYKRLGPV